MIKTLNNFDYPISKNSLESIAYKITTAVAASSCYTFSFNPIIGGARSWMKFILLNKVQFLLTNKKNNHKYISFEPVEAIEQSNLAFFFLLLDKITNGKNLKNYNEYSLKEIIDQLKLEISSQQKKIVVFIIKLDSFKNLNPTLGNLLYTIWKDNKDKISFITTLSENTTKKDVTDNLGGSKEIFNQNFEEIKKVSETDIRQSMLHWSHKLGCKFSDEESLCILKYSQGSPYLSKTLCQQISKRDYGANLNNYCQVISSTFISQFKNNNLIIKNSGNSILLNNIDISSKFTYQEFSVLKLLIENIGTVVNKDNIADSLWGEKAFEKYSDWAIDKFVSLIRIKLKKLNFAGEIKAKKGEGFILIQ